MKLLEPIYIKATALDGKVVLALVDAADFQPVTPAEGVKAGAEKATRLFGSPVAPMFPAFVPPDWQITTRHLQSMRHVSGYEREKHIGVDINRGGNNADLGLPVYSCADGTVVYAQVAPGNWGRLVCILHTDNSTFRYAHLQEIHVSSGENVKRGQKIGTIGNSNGRFEAHIHMDASPDNFIALHPTAWPGISQRNIDRFTDPIAYIDRRAWWR